MREEILDYKRLNWDDYQEFVPVVDGAGGVIPDVPEDLAKHRKKIPMMIGTTRDETEKLADNLTLGYKQFQNHRLIAEGCKAQYVWTKVDPSMSDSILFDSVLKAFGFRKLQLDQRHPTPENSGFPFNWTSTNAMELNYLSITDSPTMEVGYRWQGHVFWNWYARSLDAVDVGNLQRIAQLDRDVGNW
ncbi:hypothetical protein OSTOST_20324, partial [Ostertagia ostertagi]